MKSDFPGTRGAKLLGNLTEAQGIYRQPFIDFGLFSQIAALK